MSITKLLMPDKITPEHLAFWWKLASENPEDFERWYDSEMEVTT